MKNILLVGGYESVRRALDRTFARQNVPLQITKHWGSERNGTNAYQDIPKGIDAVLIITNFCSHAASNNAIAACKKQGVPYIDGPHKWSKLQLRLTQAGWLNTNTSVDTNVVIEKEPEMRHIMPAAAPIQPPPAYLGQEDAPEPETPSGKARPLPKEVLQAREMYLESRLRETNGNVSDRALQRECKEKFGDRLIGNKYITKLRTRVGVSRPHAVIYKVVDATATANRVNVTIQPVPPTSTNTNTTNFNAALELLKGAMLECDVIAVHAVLTNEGKLQVKTEKRSSDTVEI